MAGREVPAELRVCAQLRGWGGVGKLGAHASRRVAAIAILSAGEVSTQLLNAEKWRFSAYRPLLDPGYEKSQAVADILIETSDVEP